MGFLECCDTEQSTSVSTRYASTKARLKYAFGDYCSPSSFSHHSLVKCLSLLLS